MEAITTPILLIGFNRPDDIKESFEAIRKVQPSKLYVAIDGPRPNKEDEVAKVNAVKQIVKNVDWNCETHYRFSENNLGCKGNIPSSITWVLENEDRVIIIEDDVVAPYSFFLFEQQMLEKYKDDNGIAMVTGNNYTPIDMEYDYSFSVYGGHIWGWGTWKRAWSKFDLSLPFLKTEINNGFPKLKTITTSKEEFCYYVNYCLWLKKVMLCGKDNFWGPQFGIYRIINGFLNIVPKVNLASNIGYLSSRSSVNNTKKGEYYYEAHSDFFVQKTPPKVQRNIYFDRYHFRHHLRPQSLLRRIYSYLKNKDWRKKYY